MLGVVEIPKHRHLRGVGVEKPVSKKKESNILKNREILTVPIFLVERCRWGSCQNLAKALAVHVEKTCHLQCLRLLLRTAGGIFPPQG